MNIGRIAAYAAVIACAGVCSAAVEPGENIVLNGAFEADQASSPPFWNVGKPEKVSWKPSGGPDGKPYMSISSDEADSAETTIRQYGLRLENTYDRNANTYTSILWANGITAEATGTYRCVITDATGVNKTSAQATVTVN